MYFLCIHVNFNCKEDTLDVDAATYRHPHLALHEVSCMDEALCMSLWAKKNLSHPIFAFMPSAMVVMIPQCHVTCCQLTHVVCVQVSFPVLQPLPARSRSGHVAYRNLMVGCAKHSLFGRPSVGASPGKHKSKARARFGQ